jgi:hypothetical protein
VDPNHVLVGDLAGVAHLLNHAGHRHLVLDQVRADELERNLLVHHEIVDQDHDAEATAAQLALHAVTVRQHVALAQPAEVDLLRPGSRNAR